MKDKSQHFDPRQTMKNDDFEIFHYRDPKGTDVEVHHHDFYEIYLFLGGKVEYWVEGKVFHLNPGDILLINPLELHRPIVSPESNIYERIVLWINKDHLKSIGNESSDLTRCFDSALPTHTNLIRTSSSLTAKLYELSRESYKDEFGSSLCAKGIFLQFMVELNRMSQNSDAIKEHHTKSSPLVADVLRYISEHCSEELSLETIAERFYVSKYHLSHQFSKETGVSVYRYIMLKRLLVAKQMLLAGAAAGDVCYSCGFRDYAGFYRAFKSEYGISPREFASGESLLI